MTPHIRALAVSAALVIAVVPAGVPAAAQRGRLRERAAARSGGRTDSVSINSGGRTRRYLLHAPAGDARGPLALVIAFHGGSQSPEDMERMSGFSAAADRERFIAAYPEGVEKSWADGRGTTAADKQGVDDVAFTRAVIADVEKTHAIDRRRLFATGPSNGGTMSHRLGCEMADTFAAIGPVIAAIPTRIAPSCHPAAPLAVVSIQGVDDPLMPFGGGEEGQGSARRLGVGGAIESARATQDLWRANEGCGATPAISTPPATIQDGTSVTRRAYSGCRGGADVVWYEIAGGGHRWPPERARGPAEALAERAFGVSSQNIDATATLWAFFAAHARR
jgi:polyhydroxybutyrate depolymerase